MRFSIRSKIYNDVEDAKHEGTQRRLDAVTSVVKPSEHKNVQTEENLIDWSSQLLGITVAYLTDGSLGQRISKNENN